MQTNELEQLLDDVQRILDGLSGIDTLIVKMMRRESRPPWTQTPEARRELSRVLRSRLAAAEAVGSRHVHVHVGDLDDLLAAFEARQEPRC